MLDVIFGFATTISGYFGSDIVFCAVVIAIVYLYLSRVLFYHLIKTLCVLAAAVLVVTVDHPFREIVSHYTPYVVIATSFLIFAAFLTLFRMLYGYLYGLLYSFSPLRLLRSPKLLLVGTGLAYLLTCQSDLLNQAINWGQENPVIASACLLPIISPLLSSVRMFMPLVSFGAVATVLIFCIVEGKSLGSVTDDLISLSGGATKTVKSVEKNGSDTFIKMGKDAKESNFIKKWLHF